MKTKAFERNAREREREREEKKDSELLCVFSSSSIATSHRVEDEFDFDETL